MGFDLKQAAKDVSVPTTPVTIQRQGKEALKIDLPMLTVGDLEALDKRLHFDVWALMLEIYRMMQDAEKETLEADKAAKKADVGLTVYGRLNSGIQIEMFHAAFLHIDPTVTREEVDRLISYGIQAQDEYIHALMFMLQGVTQAEAEAQAGKKTAAADPLGPKVGPTSSAPSPAADVTPPVA